MKIGWSNFFIDNCTALIDCEKLVFHRSLIVPRFLRPCHWFTLYTRVRRGVAAPQDQQDQSLLRVGAFLLDTAIRWQSFGMFHHSVHFYLPSLATTESKADFVVSIEVSVTQFEEPPRIWATNSSRPQTSKEKETQICHQFVQTIGLLLWLSACILTI